MQLVKKFLAFYGTRRFITALTSLRHLSLSCPSIISFNCIIQFIPLCLNLLLPFVTRTKILTRVFMSLHSPSPSCLQSGHLSPLRKVVAGVSVNMVSFDQKPVHMGFMVNNLLLWHFSTTSRIYHRAVHEAVSCNKTLKRKIGQNCTL